MIKTKDDWKYRQEMLVAQNKEKAKRFAKRKDKLKKHQEAHAKAVANSKGFTPGPVVKRNHQWPTAMSSIVSELEAEAKDLSKKIEEEESV